FPSTTLFRSRPTDDANMHRGLRSQEHLSGGSAMSSRRRFLQQAALLAALTQLPHAALWAQARLQQRAIPSSGELLPVIGLGTSRTHDVPHEVAALQPSRECLQHTVICSSI